MPRNEAVIDKWVAALRSGNYKQGRLKLNRLDREVTTYCCLGVLCELAVAEGIIPPAVNNVYGSNYTTLLPPAVQTWVGLNSNSGRYGPSHYDSLVNQNDSGTSFDEIANIIETKKEQLFEP